MSQVAGISSTSTPQTEGIDLEAMTLQEAIVNGKPTLVDFGGRNCAPCQQMEIILTDIAIKYEGKLNVLIVQAAENPELSQLFKITTIPTQYFLDESGSPIGMHVGVLYGEAIEAQLQNMGLEPN